MGLAQRGIAMDSRTRKPRLLRGLENTRRAVMVLCGVLVGCAVRLPSERMPVNMPPVPSEAEVRELMQEKMGKPALAEEPTQGGIQVVFQTGHASTISSVALSADGRYIASSSWDETAKLWDVASGQEIRTITGVDHGTSVSFAGDTGRVVLNWFMGLRLIDGATGRPLQDLDGGFEQVVVSGGGRFAARHSRGDPLLAGQRVRSIENLISVVDLRSDRTLATLKIDDTTTPFAMSDDGSTLILRRFEIETRRMTALAQAGKAAVPESQLEVWDVATGKLRGRLETAAAATTGLPTATALSPDGELLVTESFDQSLGVYHVPTGELRQKLATPSSGQWVTSNALLFSPDGKLLARATQDGNIRVYEMPGGRLVAELEGTAVNFSADGRKLVAGKQNGGAPFLHDLESGKDTQLAGGASAISDLALVGDGRFVVAATETGGARLWDLATGELIRTFECPGGTGVHSLSASPAAPWLATGCYDGAAYLWNLQTGAQLRTLRAPVAGQYGVMTMVRFDPDGRRLALGAREELSVWDAASGERIQHIVLPRGQLPYLHGPSLAESLDQLPEAQRDAMTAQATDPRLLPLMHGIHALEFHPDGQRIAVGKSYELTLWDIASGRRIREFSSAAARTQESPPTAEAALADKLFSGGALSKRDMKVLADAQRRGALPQAMVRDPASMDEMLDDTGMSDGARAIAFSADGRTLFALGTSGKQVWEVETGRKMGAPRPSWVDALDPSALQNADPGALLESFMPEEIGQAEGLALSPDGRFAARGHGRVIKVWDLVSGQDVAELVGHTSDISSLAYAHGGRLLVSGARDGAVRVWTMPQGQELVQLIGLGASDYVTVTPDRYYRASRRRIGGVAFRVQDQLYPFEQFDLRFNRPDILLERLGRAAPPVVQSYRAAYERRLKKMGFTESMLSGEFHLPEVTLLSTNVPVTTPDASLALRLRATDGKYALDRINVFVNDVPVFGTAGLPLTSRDAQTHEQEVRVPLVPGRNKVQVSALNQQGAESLRQTVYTTSTANPGPPDVHIVAIGVSQYQKSAYNLRFAAKDATDLMNMYQRVADRTHAYGQVHVLDLTNENATRTRIRQAKDWLSQARVNDLVVVFAAGHGMMDAHQNYYFGTHDIDPERPEINGLPYEDFEGLLDGIAPLQKVLLIDTCFSGEVDKDEPTLVAQVDTAGAGTVSVRAFKAARGVSVVADSASDAAETVGGAVGAEMTSPAATDIVRFQQELFADLRRGTGAVVISSASGNEYALEGEQWSNGVFTYALLDGLKNARADVNRDQTITVSELQAHVIAEVRKLTAGGQNPTVRRENLEYDFAVY